MSMPILTTKLYIPPPRPQAVLRPRLLERLNEGLDRKLTLISAPAGFGKTTLVSTWVGSCNRPTAWLSLNQEESDPARFLTYLIAALQTVAVNLGEGALAALRSPPPPTEALLTALLNDITTIPDHFVLVLDDYHVVDSQPVDQALTFLLEHLPPKMHLVIATREDPSLPLARLRARGHMTEVRAADLRFTPAEAATFLNQVMHLDLSTEQVAALETRTEGWIAGLQLAALSIQGRESIPEFIRAFSGNNRYIVDYLVEEVLQRQPEHVRDFLLQTSILDRLSGSLCDAVTGQKTGSVLLEALERNNLFVVSLDDKRHWYRYHHLLADVLHAHLMAEQPDRVALLHRRASDWHEQNGVRDAAIRHALAAQDFERAAGLIERAWPVMDGTFQTAAWLRWAHALPDEVVRVRPVLSLDYAWAFLNAGELEAGAERLRDAERCLESQAATHEQHSHAKCTVVVDDEEQYRHLPASIATARAYYAQSLGDLSATLAHGRRALDLLPEQDYLRRGVVGALLGLAYWTNGELETAHRTLAEGMENMHRGGNSLFALRGAYGLADIRLAQGRLQEAIQIYAEAVELAAGADELFRRGTADLHLGLSDLYLELDNFESAAKYLRQAEVIGEHDGSAHWRYRLCLGQARIAKAQGDLTGALERLDEALSCYVPTPVPDVTPIAAQKARIWIAQGNLSKARQWAHERGLSVDDDLSYLREFEYITLARLLIAEYRHGHLEHSIQDATTLLARLLDSAQAGQRMGGVLEILVLQALAHQAQGNVAPALAALERALELAQPEGYVRLFVDEGQPMAQLLSQAAAQGMMPDYVGELLAVIDAAGQTSPDAFAPPVVAPARPSLVQRAVLVEPLSEREIEVLDLIAQGLSNREIGERLFLALSTVKGHNRNIFGKLQVQRRTEAVARARELGLL